MVGAHRGPHGPTWAHMGPHGPPWAFMGLALQQYGFCKAEPLTRVHSSFQAEVIALDMASNFLANLK